MGDVRSLVLVTDAVRSDAKLPPSTELELRNLRRKGARHAAPCT